jgi:hypothetical protein
VRRRRRRRALPRHARAGAGTAAALEPLLDSLFRDWVPRSFNPPSPVIWRSSRRRAVPAALADFITNTTDRYTASGRRRLPWCSSRPTPRLAARVDEVSADARGFHQRRLDGDFNAIVCARERHLGAEIRRGFLYCSTRPTTRC